MQRNVVLTYIFSMIFYFQTDTALWPIFVTDKKGFSIVALGIFQVAMIMSRFIFEIPSGILSDKIGRVKVLIFSVMALIVSNLFIYFGSSIFLVCIAYVFFGMGTSFISGTLEAFLYDSLKANKLENKYKQINTNLYFMTMISFAVAMTIGGLISRIDMSLMYIINIAVLIFGIITCLFMKEPPQMNQNNSTVKNIINSSISILKNNMHLIYLISFITLTTAVNTFAWNFSQKQFSIAGMPNEYISIESIITTLIYGLAAKLGYFFEKKFGKMTTSVFTASILVFPLILFGSTMNIYLMLFSLTLISVSASFATPIFSDYINKEVNSSRSTIISIESFISGVFTLLCSVLLGLIQNIGLSFVIIGIIAIPIYIYILTKIKTYTSH